MQGLDILLELRGFRPGRDLSTADMISLWTTANTMLRAYEALGFDTPEWLPRAMGELERGLRERRPENRLRWRDGEEDNDAARHNGQAGFPADAGRSVEAVR